MAEQIFFHSQLDYKNTLDRLVQPGTRWLDVGCGCSIVPGWIRGSVDFQKELISRCDIALGCDPVDGRPHQADLEKYVGDCSVLPYEDGCFNLVTANMVAEHIENPLVFAEQVHRVLTPGGKFVFHTPNLHYPPVFIASLLPDFLVRKVARIMDGRSDEDIFPTHYRLNTRKAISSLPGFQAVEISCKRTGPLLQKLPVIRSIESAFICNGTSSRLRGLQADWIAVLEKVS